MLPPSLSGPFMKVLTLFVPGNVYVDLADFDVKLFLKIIYSCRNVL
jgi:hypothetical protein